MRSFYFPLVLTISGNILYHVAQKSVTRTANPLVTMMIAYGVGIIVCAIAFAFYPAGKPFLSAVKEANWAACAIGIGATAVEIGYLLAYRTGWNISLAPILTSVAVTLLLIPIGLLIFREQLSAWNVLGIVFCIMGLVLITHK
jgi:drug/metabolite transporter (DMT)-like permease